MGNKMKSFKVTVFMVLVFLSGFMLTGCAPQPPTTDKVSTSQGGLSGISTGYVELPDGREVLCVSNWESTHGGLSCDWESIPVAR